MDQGDGKGGLARTGREGEDRSGRWPAGPGEGVIGEADASLFGERLRLYSIVHHNHLAFALLTCIMPRTSLYTELHRVAAKAGSYEQHDLM